MSKRTRRKRRQARMKIRSRGKFKVDHKARAGRTGSVHKKKLQGAITEAERRRDP